MKNFFCKLLAVAGMALTLTGCAAEIMKEGPYSMDKLPPIFGAEQYGSRVLLLDANLKDWNTPKAVLWNWHPVFDTVNLPVQCIPWFGGITDAKPVMNMTHVLITGSCGAVSLVRMSDKRTIFCVYCAGVHSAELLPDGNVVATGAGPGGQLELFDISTYDPMHPEWTRSASYPLPYSHGAVWDNEKKCLWVDDHRGISRWEYTAKPRPKLKETAVYPVPGFDFYWGHDLYPVPGTKSLFLTGDGATIFDTVTCTYIKKPISKQYFKSISQAYPDGPIIVQIPEEQWWTEKALLFNAKDDTTTLFRERKNMRFYKFRWFVHNDFSYGPYVPEKTTAKPAGK